MKSFIATTLACLCSLAQADLKPRDFAPAFKNINAVVDSEFTKVSLSDYADQYLVVLFYPFDFTYVCPTELIAYSEATEKF